MYEDIMHTPNGTFTKHVSQGGDGADVKIYVDDPEQLRFIDAGLKYGKMD